MQNPFLIEHQLKLLVRPQNDDTQHTNHQRLPINAKCMLLTHVHSKGSNGKWHLGEHTVSPERNGPSKDIPPANKNRRAISELSTHWKI